MNCKNCGLQLDNGAAYCGNCGMAVAAPTIDTNLTAAPQPAAPNSLAASPPSQPSPVQPVPAPAVVPQPNPVMQPAQPPQHGMQGQPYAYAQPTAGGNSKGVASLVCGILSIPAAIIPIAGLGLGIAAIIFSGKSKKQAPGNGMATAGLVLGIIGIVFGFITWGININDRMDSEGYSGSAIRVLHP